MDLFITSAVLYAFNFSHLNKNRVFMHERRNNISFLSMRADGNVGNSVTSVWMNDTVALCSALRSDEVEPALYAANALLEEYNQAKHMNIGHSVHSFEFSCVLYDATIGHMMLLSDQVGSNSLWYSFRSTLSSENSFIVTNDLISASSIGFTDFTAVSCGNIHTISMLGYFITDITHYQSQIMQPALLQSEFTELPKIYSKFVYRSGLLSVQSVVENQYDPLLTVFVHTADTLRPSSLLLNCLLARLKTSHMLINRPAATAIVHRDDDFEKFKAIMGAA
jgi:hypothetical protein